MFPLVQPRGAIVRPKAIHVPKKPERAHILPKNLVVISEKLQLGWDVAYVDGSKNEEGGVQFAGYRVWFGPNDERNIELPLTVHEKQTITRAKLTAPLHAIEHKTPSKPLLIVSDSDLVCVGLQSKCVKCSRHK